MFIKVPKKNYFGFTSCNRIFTSLLMTLIFLDFVACSVLCEANNTTSRHNNLGNFILFYLFNSDLGVSEPQKCARRAGGRAKVRKGRARARRSNVSNASAMILANSVQAVTMAMDNPIAEALVVANAIKEVGKVIPHIVESADVVGDMIANGSAEGPSAEAHFEEKAGQAEGSVKISAGRFTVKEENLSAEANGPNTSARFVANDREVGAMVGAELGSASVSAGPVGVKVGLGVETGARISADGGEVKVLGCGLSLGRTTGISLFGNELKFKLW